MPLREFDRQVDTLLAKGYPAAARRDASDFLTLLRPLRDRVADVAAPTDSGHVPFVIVVSGRLVAPELAITLTDWQGRAGFTTMTADDLAGFTPIDGIERVASPVHLVCDVDTGGEFRDMRPDDALPVIEGRGREVLTLEEGLALVTQRPEILADQTCYQMLGSRCGDKRVTGVWLSKKHPRLGWCWGGNPHSWLGMASAGARLAGRDVS